MLKVGTLLQGGGKHLKWSYYRPFLQSLPPLRWRRNTKVKTPKSFHISASENKFGENWCSSFKIIRAQSGSCGVMGSYRHYFQELNE